MGWRYEICEFTELLELPGCVLDLPENNIILFAIIRNIFYSCRLQSTLWCDTSSLIIIVRTHSKVISLKGRWWPDIGWKAIPDQWCSGVKCKRAEFSFWVWLYEEIWTGWTKLLSGLVVVHQREQIRWCACVKNFVSESSYFKLDPWCHW